MNIEQYLAQSQAHEPSNGQLATYVSPSINVIIFAVATKLGDSTTSEDQDTFAS